MKKTFKYNLFVRLIMRKKKELPEEQKFVYDGEMSPEAIKMMEERAKLRYYIKMINPGRKKAVIIVLNNLEVSVIEVDAEGKQKQVFKKKCHWTVAVWIYCKWKRIYWGKGYEMPENIPEVVEKKKRGRPPKNKGDDL